MTAAIDRFLYRANADSLVDRWQDVTADLWGAVEDLGSLVDSDASHAELVSAVQYHVERRDAMAQAIDAAEHFLADFIEQHRP